MDPTATVLQALSAAHWPDSRPARHRRSLAACDGAKIRCQVLSTPVGAKCDAIGCARSMKSCGQRPTRRWTTRRRSAERRRQRRGDLGVLHSRRNRPHPRTAFLVAERHGIGRTAAQVPGLTALRLGDALVTAVSCAPSGWCAAVGDYPDRAGTETRMFVVSSASPPAAPNTAGCAPPAFGGTRSIGRCAKAKCRNRQRVRRLSFSRRGKAALRTEAEPTQHSRGSWRCAFRAMIGAVTCCDRWPSLADPGLARAPPCFPLAAGRDRPAG